MRYSLAACMDGIGRLTMTVDQSANPARPDHTITRVLAIKDEDGDKVPLPRRARRRLHEVLRAMAPFWLGLPAPFRLDRPPELCWDEWENRWTLSSRPRRRRRTRCRSI